MTINEKAKPNGRIEQERTRRRRRDDLGLGRMRNLALTAEMDPNYVYRWVNDEPGRVQHLTVRDDWEIATDMPSDEKDKGVGSPLERVVDKTSGKRAVLLRKPKEYYLEDKAKEQAELIQTESMIKRGGTPGGDGLNGPHAYVPKDGISINSAGKSSTYTP